MTVRKTVAPPLESARVCNFDVSFCSFPIMWMLFKDVFVSNEYFFHSENPNPTILDCGSNIGMSVLYFKLIHKGARITAFEPDPAAFACLEKNIANNRLEGVQAFQKAVARHAGPVELFDDPALPGSPITSIRADRGGPRRRVFDAVSLSTYVSGAIDMLKLDVEGAEIDVLEDLAAAGALPRIRQMVIEYHHHMSPGDDRLSKALGILEVAGFRYQIGCHTPDPLARDVFQDILIRAYRA